MISKRVQGFTESVIREMTRVNNQYDGINLAQGMPNFPPPRELVEAAHRAIDGDFHQYAITWGTPRLRQAIAWAIDRTEIVKLVYYDAHVVTAEPTPEPSPWATGVNAHKGGPDLARAKQLLADAGKGSGLSLTYLVKSQVPVLVKTGEILREQLKKVGITLDVRPLESGQYFEELVGKKFDIAGGYWSVTVDPDMFYYPMQHSSSAWNFCGFKSEEADKRLDAFRFTASPAARKKMYPELVRWFQEEGSLVVFSNELQRYWMKPNVQGSTPLSSLELRFEDTWLG